LQVADDGSDLHGCGFWLRDEDDLATHWDDDRLSEIDVLVVKVAGVSYRADALQAADFNPGSPLALVPEPDNPIDSNAIAIYDRARTHQVGFVPADRCSEVAELLQRVPESVAISLWEWRLHGAERCALRTIIGPPWLTGALASSV